MFICPESVKIYVNDTLIENKLKVTLNGEEIYVYFLADHDNLQYYYNLISTKCDFVIKDNDIIMFEFTDIKLKNVKILCEKLKAVSICLVFEKK